MYISDEPGWMEVLVDVLLSLCACMYISDEPGWTEVLVDVLLSLCVRVCISQMSLAGWRC